jgi:GT2 family glycosyltransferase
VSVGIVVVTFHCRELALTCIESIARGAPQVLPHTVVVDNDSRDGTVEAIRRGYPDVRVIENQRNVGFATAVNAGLGALAEEQVICLLNPDSMLLDDNLIAAAEYLDEHAEIGVMGGRIVNDDGSLQPSARAFPSHLNAFFNRHSLTTKLFPGNRWSSRYLMTGWAHDEVRDVDWVSGAFMLIHRRAIEAVGTLDEGYFFSIEDVDYCRRVHDAGLSVVYYPMAAVRHRVGGSSRHAVYRAMAAHHRGMWRYYRRHMRGNLALDLVTAGAITGRFGIHAVSYAARTAKNRLLGRPNP